MGITEKKKKIEVGGYMLKKGGFTRMARKVFVPGLAIIMLASMGLNSEKVSYANEGDKLGINPTPQSVTEKGAGFSLTPVVSLVISKETDAAAIREVEAALLAANVEKVERINAGEPLPKTGVTIWIGGPSENQATVEALENLNTPGPEELKDEGYVLVSKANQNGHNQIILAGKDQVGTFYAAQTFKQMIQERSGDNWIPAVEIRDWPEMPIRGTIEGFYGPPWSHEDRLKQLQFYGENKMNTYIYAPKDDPYHRDRWREPYPEEELKALKELVKKANDDRVNFTFGISPGNTICFSDDQDFEALLDKAEAVWELGVRSYAIFLDDIDPTLRCAADIGKFQGMHNPSAAAQAYLLNRFNEEFLQTHEGAEQLITVPTDYSGNGTTVYREQFAESVQEDIIIMWTGEKVVSDEITSEGAKQVWDVFQHDLLVWDNYPVNDFDRESLFLGPLVKRDKDLTDFGVVGLTANPMNEAEASKISLYTIADYTWNPMDYDPDESWERSIQSLGGDAAEMLRTFAENSFSSPINRKESLTLTPLINRFWEAYQLDGGEDAATQLIAEFEKLQRISDDLKQNLNNEKFLLEVEPYMEKLRLYGEAGEVAVRYLQATKGNQTAEASEYLKQLITLYNQSEQIPQKMGQGVIKPFLLESALTLAPLEMTLQPSIDAFWTAYESGNINDEANQLMTKFEEYQQIAITIRKDFDNKEFLQAVEPYLRNLEVYGEAGEVAVHYLMAITEEQTDKADEYKRNLRTLMVQAYKMPQQIGEQVIKPFLIKSMWDPSVSTYRMLDGVNRSRGGGQLIQYTPFFGERTRTNNWGYEVTVVDDIVVSSGGNDSAIPKNGYVLSVHADDWLRDYAVIGAHIQIEDGMVLVRRASEEVDVELSLKMNGEVMPDDVTLVDTETVEFTWEVISGGNGSEKVTATFDGVAYEEGTIVDLAGKPGEPKLVVTVTDKAGNKQEVTYVINVTTSAADMKTLVNRYEESGDFKNSEAARALNIHLVALERYEEQQAKEKLVKHLTGLLVLLNHQIDNELISQKAYDVLKADTDYLLKKWN
ncbi:beta-N-acetylglucosaminidase domain-containing protein [Sporosarcina sp. NPDC096371]|uniref:beta-N-acetylhexosaminidase family protein n=1 Tax=Sporosarcina sp. NPDC096371 TaxID=3364530 RepID=UPI00381F99C2